MSNKRFPPRVFMYSPDGVHIRNGLRAQVYHRSSYAEDIEYLALSEHQHLLEQARLEARAEAFEDASVLAARSGEMETEGKLREWAKEARAKLGVSKDG